ncbi:EF-hand domain-containing protein [Arenimonas sp.]|uniref:EF-hand domain-containing protein n=1 Tax=Arenimonas sp. TaxID=1872635 RepID=UPI0039E2F019
MKKSLAVLALFAVAGVALAQSAGESPGPRRAHGDLFAERDGNKDGRISLAEWQQGEQARQKAMFERIDADRDGLVTREEIQKQRGQRHERMRAQRDQRRDRMEKLRELDKDGDHALSRTEIGDRLPKLAENFERLDGNRDGKLTREEIRAGRSKMRGEPAGK